MAEAAASRRLRYRVVGRALLRDSSALYAKKTGSVLVPGEVVEATEANGTRVHVRRLSGGSEIGWVSTQTADGRVLLVDDRAILLNPPPPCAHLPWEISHQTEGVRRMTALWPARCCSSRSTVSGR